MRDYCCGLTRKQSELGRAAGWAGTGTASGRGGALDLERNAHYGDPLNGDVREVVPGRLVAFRGPRDTAAGRHFSDGGGGWAPSGLPLSASAARRRCWVSWA